MTTFNTRPTNENDERALLSADSAIPHPIAPPLSSSSAAQPNIERYHELLVLVQTFEKDFVKFYERGNKEAGVRLRKHMQTLRQFAQQVRDEVQERKQPSGE
jgi:hypothetical protein